MPTVSIVMPVYNAEQYIEEALVSIEDQTLTDWELIIVNEPTSTDLTNDIVKKYMEKDARIKLVINETKLGISKSLNVGLRMAEGKYIARMDADDISLPNRLEEQVDYMEEHPEIGISGCDYDVLGESWKSDLLVDEEEIKADLLFFVPLRHPTIIMRREMLEKNGLEYSEVFFAAEDYDLFVRSIKYFKIANLNKKLLIYRRHENATVYRMIGVGATVNKILGRNMLGELGMSVSDEDIDLLYNHAYLHREAEAYNMDILRRFESLLERIWEANLSKKEYEKKALFRVLIKRWDKEISAIKNSKEIETTELEEFIENSVFEMALYDALQRQGRISNTLTIYMMVDPSACNVIKGVKSVINQSYVDWSMKVVGDFTDKGIVRKLNIICSLFSQVSYEVTGEAELPAKLEQLYNEGNSGFISIINGHDYLFPHRYNKQIADLNTNLECMASICSVRNSTQVPNNDFSSYKINLLFGDAVDYSAVVFRRGINSCSFTEHRENFIENFLTDIVEKSECVVSSEELLEKDKYFILPNQIDKRYIQRLNLSPVQEKLVLSAKAEYVKMRSTKNQEKYKEELKKVYLKICKKNRKIHCFDQELLESRLVAEWLWITENGDRYALNEYYDFKEFLKISGQAKLHLHNKVIMKLDRFFYNHSKYRHYDELMNRYLQGSGAKVNNTIDEEILKRWTWERYQYIESKLDKLYVDIENDMDKLRNGIERKVDQKVWDAERRIIVIDDLAINLSHIKNRTPYIPGERVRVVIVFQVASFWPSIASLYQELMTDERFEVIIMCYDEPIDASIKTETARVFLKENDIPFIDWIDFSMKDYNPHIVIIQTPYDSNRRKEFKSNYLKMAGYRVVYIPYGMEIGDTQHSRKQQLDHIVRRYAWKIFTFSETIHRDYRMYSEQEDNVFVTGLPKFDSLYHKELFPLNPKIREKAEGRKVILWKVHFPKVVKVNGKMELFTPDINEYIKFADYIQSDTGNFYIFMPHPRFLEFNEDKNIYRQLKDLLGRLEMLGNVFIDNADDYRNSLLNADAIIVDRSSVMVEAAVVGVPVLLMYNHEFREPMTQAISPLLDSYYQGDSCVDMIAFVEMVNMGQDTKKGLRRAMFKKCIPYFDGKCSERIKDEIYSSLLREK